MIRTALNPFVALLIAVLPVACGGGGGSGAPGSSNQSPPRNDAEVQRAQAILETCGADALDTLLGIFGTFAIVPGAADLPITLLPIEGDAIPFTADLDSDLQDEVMGVFTFLDASGDPSMPFTQDQLASGIDSLVALLTSLPNGTKLQVNLTPAPTLGLESGVLIIAFLGGLPVSIDGFSNSFGDHCHASLSFANVSPLSLLGQHPSVPLAATIGNGTDTLIGTIALNGTSMASVDVALNGGSSMAFSLDLTTGAVTPLGAG